MGFLDKAKAAAEQAAAKAKEGVEDVQNKRELSQAYSELGKAAFELLESGTIANATLEGHAEKIRALQARAAGNGVPAGVSNVTTVEPTDPGQPPATPT
jgi:hypothetical protein